MALMKNMNQYDDSVGFELLPKADFLMAVDEWEVKTNATDPDKVGLNIKYIICDGRFENRSFFQYYCLQNPSAQAVKLAGSALKNLMLATGLNPESDLEESHLDSITGKPFVGRVSISKAKADSEYDDQNRLAVAYSREAYNDMPEKQRRPQPAVAAASSAQQPANQAPATNSAPATDTSAPSAKPPWE